LWLDEGLAKYFELPAGRHGLNEQYVRQIAAAMDQGAWHPCLARLEQLPPTVDMSQEDYVEAWAWVHFLLNSRPACNDLLRRYLAELRGRDQPAPLDARLTALVGHPEWELLEHMRKLAAARRPDAAASGEK
jgi:hypothetical protein